ncbi:MAG: hypothetical protein WCT16_04855 [Candidatus Buchananbacteria bacterium]
MTKLLLPMAWIGLMVWWFVGQPIAKKIKNGQPITIKEQTAWVAALLFLVIAAFGAFGTAICMVVIIFESLWP